MWSSTNYASYFGPVVGVSLTYFVLVSGGCNFSENSFLLKIYNFSSVSSNKVPQPLHLLLVGIVLLACKAEFGVLVWEVFVRSFDLMEPMAEYYILLGFSTLLGLLKKLKK